MKNLQICFFCFSVSIAYGQKNTFLSFPSKGSVEYNYVMGEDSFKDCYLSDTINKNETNYRVRIRKYSWDKKNDTALIREDKNNYYIKSIKDYYEYIEIPKHPKNGQIWYNFDSSWVYKINNEKAQLRTPLKFYENVIELEASQNPTKNNNSSKFAKYLNFYDKRVG